MNERLDDVTILGLIVGIVVTGFGVMATFGYVLYKRMKCKLDREEFRRHTGQSKINKALFHIRTIQLFFPRLSQICDKQSLEFRAVRWTNIAKL